MQATDTLQHTKPVAQLKKQHRSDLSKHSKSKVYTYFCISQL